MFNMNSVDLRRAVQRVSSGMRINTGAYADAAGRHIDDSFSAISDVNMAEKVLSLTKLQILTQTDVAVLAHSNADSWTVFRLLQQGA